MNKLTYSIDTVNRVLNYLAERPYKEVVGLIQSLQSGEVVKQEEEEKDA